MSSSPLYLAIVIVWAIVLIPMLLRRDASDPAAGSLRRTAPRAADDSEGDSEEEPEDDADHVRRDDRDHDAFDELDDDIDDIDDTESADSESDDGTRTHESHSGPARAAPARRTGRYREELHHTGSEDTAPSARSAHGRPVFSRARVIARRRRRTSGLTALLIGTAVAVAADLGPWWVLLPPVALLMGHLVLLREAARADSEHRAAEREYRRRRAEHLRRRAVEAEAAAARQAEIIEFVARRDQVYDQYADAHLRAAGD